MVVVVVVGVVVRDAPVQPAANRTAPQRRRMREGGREGGGVAAFI